MRKQAIESARHWVVKLGSAVFLRDGDRVDRPTFAGLIDDIDALKSQGIRVTLVSSGAVALGRQSMGLGAESSMNIPRLQAFAAMGQSRLMQMYETEFSHYGHKVAQILMTRQDLDDRRRFLNARLALQTVHEFGAVPIINENDTVATDELRFGDNDQLAAMTCGLVKADLLVLLSDVEGIYEIEQDPLTKSRRFMDRIAEVEASNARLDEIAGPSESGVGTGGMHTKILAARIAARFGVSTIIAPGKRRGVLQQIAQQGDVGTLVYSGKSQPLVGVKVWLGGGARAVGALRCDAGAVRAVRANGASLLASGIEAVEGSFEEGSVVEMIGPDDVVFARGLVAYNSQDIRTIAGHHSDKIEALLGYKILDAVVHRDSLVLL